MKSDHYSGLTVNERLFIAGRLQQFDESALARDARRMVDILEQVELTPAQAMARVEDILSNPSKFGYGE